jgi:hypothetical protein
MRNWVRYPGKSLQADVSYWFWDATTFRRRRRALEDDRKIGSIDGLSALTFVPFLNLLDLIMVYRHPRSDSLAALA